MNKFLDPTPYKLAWQSMRKAKSRAALTMFGITIGIAMVIIVLSAGTGLKGLILGELATYGDDWINIEIKVPSTKKNSSANAGALAQGVSITTLKNTDQEAIRSIPNIKNSYAGITSQATVSRDTIKKRITTFGVSSTYADIDKTGIKFGRFFTESEDASAADVVVLGADASDRYFGNESPVGKKIKVDKRTYEVVGVMNKRGVTGFFNMDDMVFFPLRTLQKKVMGIDHVQFIIAQVKNRNLSEDTAEEVRFLMRERHNIADVKKDDFGVTTMKEAMDSINIIFNGITWLLIALSGISLLVGGVGIMNVMYVSVAERTFEIGLRKAVGAGSSDILLQFLIEAVVVTLTGGIFGMLSGVGLSFLIAVIARAIGLNWAFAIPPSSILISTGFSFAVGLLFGIYPAKKAATLDPIVAIRAE